jgi:hypothetical protein
MAAWLAQNIAALSALGAAMAFVWSAIQFILVRGREQRSQEFEAYHRLIKELVQPDPASQVAWIDRQVAVVFELRHFKRYYPVTGRILNNLRNKFLADPEFQWPYLINEIELTLQHIGEQPNSSSKRTREKPRAA